MKPAKRKPPNKGGGQGAIAVWMEQQRWSMATGLRRLGSRGSGSLMTILLIGLILSLPLALALVLDNASRWAGNLDQGNTLSVFLDPGRDAAAADVLAETLSDLPTVASVRIKTPAAGLAELAAFEGFGEAFDSLDHNPLPFVLLVEPLADLRTAELVALRNSLMAYEHVDLVQDQHRFRSRIRAVLALGRRVLILFAGLLALAVVLVIGHAARLDVHSRHQEIAVLELVGANRRFVRRPYLWAGAVCGLFAGTIAVLLLLALEALLAAPAASVLEAYGGHLAARGLPWQLLAAVPITAAVLGWLGARFAGIGHAWEPGR